MGHFKWHRPIAAAGLFVVITLPFVGQAFHVDDPNFLALARHARPNPLKLYDFTINWGRIDERAFDILANPPFGPWYAALLLPIAQDREWIYHVGFWPFLVLALFGAYRLGRRFAPEQRNWTVIWTAVSPAVVLASHTIMPDVPLLAFYASGVALAIEGLDTGKPMLACWGGLLAGLSALFRYSGMTAIPLLLLYVVLYRIRPRIAVWTLAASAAPILIWTWLSSHVYGRIHWLAMAGFEGQTLGLTFIGHKVIYQVAALGLAIGTAGAIAAVLHISLPIGARLGGLVGGIAAVALSLQAGLKGSITFLLVTGLVAGGAIIGHAVFVSGTAVRNMVWNSQGFNATDDLFLAAWLLGMALFNLWLLFVSVRYLLPAQIPTVLLLQRLVAAERRTSRWRNAVAAVATLTLSLTVAAADQQFAESYRSYVASLPPPAAQRWFTGHWGLQHYLEKAGAHSLSSEDRRSPRPGDEIVVPTYAWPQSPPRGLHATLRSSTVLPGSIPLRTFTAEGRACFYSNILAPGPTMVWLPFGFSAGPLEVLTRWEVLP